MNVMLIVLSLAVRVFGELEKKDGSPGAKVAWFFAHVLAVSVFFLGGLGVLVFGVWITLAATTQEWSWGSLIGFMAAAAAVVAGHFGQRWAERLLDPRVGEKAGQ